MDKLHPVIQECMREYHKLFKGQIRLAKICKAADTEVWKLPCHPEYLKDNKSDLCYIDQLGFCPRGNQCNFQHVPKDKIGDDFPHKLCQVIKTGVDWIVRNDSPSKRQRR